MRNPTTPSFLTFLPVTLFLLFVGWGGLAALVILETPTVWPRWLFFFLGVLACTGTALPITAFLNVRFQSKPPATAGVIMRQALWFGIYVPTLAWLRIPRVLSVSLAVLIALGFALVELLLRMRERSQWKP